MNKTIIHTIRDRSPHTKKDIEAFTELINQGYQVMDQFSYRNEYFYIMQKHTHDDTEEFTN